jgi:sucrose phosphorylase
VWTTFSPDQIDINFKNPVVLLYVIETLLMYARRGANLVRLDAATYLWSEPGTPSVHLTQTHEVIKLFRDVLDIVDPHVTLITETNVPHKDNISYFGNGYDEAQMVYNFALPPLVLHTFFRQDATALSEWAKELEPPSKATSFFNFLDSHDGVGLLGARDILAQEDIDFIIQRARENGAFISYRTGKDGKDEPYEINTTWFSALNQETSDEEIAFKVKRFVASRSIALVLKGIPAIYFHGLIGTANDIDAVIKTKSKRDINRSVVYERELFAEADKPNSKLFHIVDQLGRILEIRVRQSAFHSNGAQRVLMISPSVFANLRTSRDENEHILAVTNVTDRSCRLKIPLSEVGVEEIQWYDLVGRRGWMAEDKNLDVTLLPYDVVWLIPRVELERAIKSQGTQG